MKIYLTLFEVFVFNRGAAAIKVLINGDTGWQYAPPRPWGGVQTQKKKRTFRQVVMSVLHTL